MKVKLTLSEILFYLALFCQITGNFFKQTQFIDIIPGSETILTGLVLFSIVILIIKLIAEYYYDSVKLLITILIGLGFLLVIIITDNMLLPISLFFFMSNINNIPFRRIVTIYMILLIIYMTIVHCTYLLGFFSENNSLRSDGQIRYALGYQFVTMSSNFVFHILVMYLFVRNYYITWLEIVFLLGVSVYFYRLTDTRSAFLFSIVVIMCTIILKFVKSDNNKHNVLNRLLVQYSVLVSTLVSVGITFSYSENNKFFQMANAVLSDRLRLGKLAFELYPVKLFGNSITWIFYGDEAQMINNSVIDYLYVDSSFVNILLNYGLFVLVFICIAFFMLGKRSEFLNLPFTMALVILAIHSIFDPQFLEILYNPFILSLGYVFNPVKRQNMTID